MFINDPIKILEEAYQNLYGAINFELYWDIITDDAVGMTFFPDDGSTPQILIDVRLEMYKVPEIIAHEMAHVVAGEKSGHSQYWENVFDEIKEEYERIVGERYGYARQLY